jgi:hypothetical protein
VKAKGIPETVDEAVALVEQTASIDTSSPIPAHWPHSQIVSLAHLVTHLLARIEKLEADKPRRGRPPKAATAADAALVDRVAEHLGNG